LELHFQDILSLSQYIRVQSCKSPEFISKYVNPEKENQNTRP